jgi:hypothetical protein
LSEGYALEINELDLTGDSVILSLKKEDINLDTIPMKAGTNYRYWRIKIKSSGFEYAQGSFI